MLDALRRGAGSWVAKGFLFVLVISFAVWGVNDMFRGYGQGSLARIGNTQISADEFQRAFQRELDALARRFGQRLTAEQARTFGLDRNVLSRLIGSAAVEAHAAKLGLQLSEETVVESVQHDARFQGADGKFDKLQFQAGLRQLGLSEQGFLMMRRKDEVREQITDALVQGLTVPQPLVDLMFKFREETRTAVYFTIAAEKAVTLPEPDEAQLKEIYEGEKERFMTPEYRKVAVLLLSPADIQARAAVSDEEVKAYYERSKEDFDVPERRRVQQISFKDKAEAEAAKKAIEEGKSFLMAALEAEGIKGQALPELLVRREFGDARLRDAAFSLPKDKVSDPIQTRSGYVLLMVSEIAPGKERTFDEVKDEVRNRMVSEKAAQDLQKLPDQVEDLRAGGKSLKDAAEALKLKYVEIAATDSTGKTPEGKPAYEGTEQQRVIAAVFDAKAGVEREAIDLGNGGYAWIDVLAVTPSTQKAFEDVKADVKAQWQDRERRKAVSALAAKLVERLTKGEAIEAVAAEVGSAVTASQPFRRFGAAPGLPETMIQQAFVLPKDGAASAETADGKSRIVFKVTDINAPGAPTKEQLDALRSELTQQQQGDVLAEYLAALQERFGVSINETVLRRTLGGDRQQ